eukprot:1040799-Rhodomonas_salina.1
MHVTIKTHPGPGGGSRWFNPPFKVTLPVACPELETSGPIADTGPFIITGTGDFERAMEGSLGMRRGERRGDVWGDRDSRTLLFDRRTLSVPAPGVSMQAVRQTGRERNSSVVALEGGGAREEGPGRREEGRDRAYPRAMRRGLQGRDFGGCVGNRGRDLGRA